MATLTSAELDEQIENEHCDIRKLKQEISDLERELKFRKEKLHGMVAVRKLMREEES